MLFEEDDYIVKAKDINIDIQQSIIENIKKYIYIEIFVFFILLIQILFSKRFAIIAVMYLSFFLIINILRVLLHNWSIRIKDRTIYIKNHSGNHKIKYKDLISIQNFTRHDNMEIKDLKRNKICRIVLPYEYRFESQIEQICNSFITKNDVEQGKYFNKEFFDIREDDGNNYIEKKNKKVNTVAIMIIVLLFLIILCIMMMLELLKAIK